MKTAEVINHLQRCREKRQLGRRTKPQPRIPQAKIHAIFAVTNMSPKTGSGYPARASLGARQAARV